MRVLPQFDRLSGALRAADSVFGAARRRCFFCRRWVSWRLKVSWRIEPERPQTSNGSAAPALPETDRCGSTK
jgi:hypothetical protein